MNEPEAPGSGRASGPRYPYPRSPTSRTPVPAVAAAGAAEEDLARGGGADHRVGRRRHPDGARVPGLGLSRVPARTGRQERHRTRPAARRPRPRATALSSAPVEVPRGGRAPLPKRPKPLADPVTCAFTPDPISPAPKKVVPPPDGPVSSSGTVSVRLDDERRRHRPHARPGARPVHRGQLPEPGEQGFYDGTSCHRLSVTSGLQMLQCGDPIGDGTGGPGYTIRDEVFPELTYGRGVLAMAKTSQPDSGGSQFFLVFGDVQVPPEYTVFGSIDDAGLASWTTSPAAASTRRSRPWATAAAPRRSRSPSPTSRPREPCGNGQHA